MEAGQRMLMPPQYYSPAPRPHRLTLGLGTRPPTADRPSTMTLKAPNFLIGLICPAVCYVSCGSSLARSLWRCASTYYTSRQALQGRAQQCCSGSAYPGPQAVQLISARQGRAPGPDWCVRTAEPSLKSVNGGGGGAARSGGGAPEDCSSAGRGLVGTV